MRTVKARLMRTSSHVQELQTYPTWERYTVLSNCILQLTIRDRRRIFHLARQIEENQEFTDVFFPHFGFTLSEFAVWYMLGDLRRRG